MQAARCRHDQADVRIWVVDHVHQASVPSLFSSLEAAMHTPKNRQNDGNEQAEYNKYDRIY
jgi:hypothetical protein